MIGLTLGRRNISNDFLVQAGQATRTSAIPRVGVRHRCVKHLLQPTAAAGDGEEFWGDRRTGGLRRGRDPDWLCGRATVVCAAGRCDGAARADDANVWSGSGGAVAGGGCALAAMADCGQRAAGHGGLGDPRGASYRARPGSGEAARTRHRDGDDGPFTGDSAGTELRRMGEPDSGVVCLDAARVPQGRILGHRRMALRVCGCGRRHGGIPAGPEPGDATAAAQAGAELWRGDALALDAGEDAAAAA